MDTPQKEVVYHGIPASPGIAIGTVLLIAEHNTSYVEPERKEVSEEEINVEISRFHRALDKTRQELLDLQRRLKNTLDKREAGIFDAQMLIVDDQMLLNEVEDTIRKQKFSADYAFYKIIQRYVSAISVMPDNYIRERATDIKDVASRLISNLQGMKRPVLDHLPGQRIVIAKDLTPSDTALLDRENVQAFGIETGSRTCHTAILARSLKIPAVVGLQSLLPKVKNGDLLIVDGFLGIVILNPKVETQNLYAQKEIQEEKYFAGLLKETMLRPETIDGFCIQLSANIEQPSDIEDARRFGAAGIGLFRTEYLFINSNVLPTEEQQFECYRKVVENMKSSPVVIRTLDIGGDKLSDLLTSYHEQNPFLGLRAVRLCLENPDLLKTQLRAIYRASALGDVKIMFPMISCVKEVNQLYEIVDDVKRELTSEGRDFDNDAEIGIMIETPSAAIAANTLAKKVDFFSIGTNDLVQYTLAVDRSNERVAYLYQPSHPAILELIDRVAKAARNNQIWVSVCGEMAGDPRYTPLLIGLGVNELSMSSMSMGTIRRIVRRLRMHEAEEAAKLALNCTTPDEALEISENLLKKVAPDIVEMALKGI